MPFRFTLFALVAVLVLTACGSTPTRAEDAQPLSDEVPVETENPVVQPVAENKPVVSPDETVLEFTIDGGIVGFCDNLTIKAGGDYTLTTCSDGELSGTLPQSDRLSLKAWLENLDDFQLYTDDDAAGADKLTTQLSFDGAGSTEVTDPQKQVIYDWVNGLIIQLRPKPEMEQAAAPAVEASAQQQCLAIERPALMLVDFEDPTAIELLNVSSQASCQVTLSQPPFGRVLAAAGNLYYPVANSEAKTVTLWQLNANGEQLPLDFTAIVMEEPGPHGFMVSGDGSKIAWAQTVIDLEAEPPLYKNYLWLANSDGSELVTVLDGVENSELRFVAPVRFSTADNALFYALQPDIGGPIFGGRYDTLYKVPAANGDPEQLYACAAEENPVCITGLAHDGSAWTTLDPATDSIQVFDADGSVINSIPLPATDYVERTAFSPAGNLAFVSATLAEPGSEEDLPLPNPGYLTVLTAPYSGEPQTVLSDNTVGTLLGWITDDQLAFGAINADGVTKSAMVDFSGQVSEVSPKFVVGTLP
jgi:hypothetical protein